MFSAAMSATDFGRAGRKMGPDPDFAVLLHVWVGPLTRSMAAEQAKVLLVVRKQNEQ
jgi:hypothetical protein